MPRCLFFDGLVTRDCGEEARGGDRRRRVDGAGLTATGGLHRAAGLHWRETAFRLWSVDPSNVFSRFERPRKVKGTTVGKRREGVCRRTESLFSQTSTSRRS